MYPRVLEYEALGKFNISFARELPARCCGYTSPGDPASTPLDSASPACLLKTAPALASTEHFTAYSSSFHNCRADTYFKLFHPPSFSDTLIPCSNRHPSLTSCLCSTLRLFRLSAFFQYPASCLCSTLRLFRLSAPVVSSAKALSAADAKALPSQYSSHASHSFT